MVFATTSHEDYSEPALHRSSGLFGQENRLLFVPSVSK